MRARIMEFVPGLLAGVAGGLLADFLLNYLRRHNSIWMPIIAGPLVGLACGQASPIVSRLRGVLIALFTLGLVVVIQWRNFEAPFETDGTLRDYVSQFPFQIRQFSAFTLLPMVVNVAIAYYWGREQGIQFARRGQSGPISS